MTHKKSENEDLSEPQTNQLKTTDSVENTDNVSIGTGISGTAVKHIDWSPENEMIMVEWCDIAQCYKWLNARSHQKCSYMNAWFTIPAIVLSTISGTASFAQTSLPLSYQTYSPMVIGSINIFIGILTTVQQYLKIAELNEAHRVSSISWDKFARNIRIELAKKPDERMDAGNFLKLNRHEFDRLMETSPTVNDKVVQEFNNKFKGKVGSAERKRFDELKKPDICDIIVSANETRHHWYLDLEIEKQNELNALAHPDDDKSTEESSKIKDMLIRLQQHKLNKKEHTLEKKKQTEIEMMQKQKEEMEKNKKRIEENKKNIEEIENMYKQKTKCVSDYITKFEEVYSRKPIYDEIMDNMKGEVESEILNKFLTIHFADDNV